MSLLGALLGGLSTLMGGTLTVLLNIPPLLKPLVLAAALWVLGEKMIGDIVLELLDVELHLLGLTYSTFIWLVIFGVIIFGYITLILDWYSFWGIDTPR